MLAAGEKIFEVKIGGLQYVKNGQVLTLPFIETDNFFPGLAAGCVDELQPSVAPAIQNFQGTELRICALPIHPANEFLEMLIDGDVSGFVDKLKPAFKPRYKNGSAAAMRVARAGFGFHKHARIRTDVEEFCDFIPIGSQAFEKLAAKADPIFDTRYKPPRQ